MATLNLPLPINPNSPNSPNSPIVDNRDSVGGDIRAGSGRDRDISSGMGDMVDELVYKGYHHELLIALCEHAESRYIYTHTHT